MNLADRLRGVLRTGNPVAGPPVHSRREPGAGADSPGLPGLEDALGGEWRQAGDARSFVVERKVTGDESCGHLRVSDRAGWLHRAERPASLLLGQSGARPPFVFFDLETTGLSGGAGTYAFLVGCGWFEADGSFVTRQHVMAAPDDEKAMLLAVAADLAKAGVLVSFNGKSFDAPVLETRYLFQRLEWTGGATLHLDLLHPARRFWGRGRDSGCSLGVLEQRIAGVTRHDDVPGAEIPARYFEFLRSGDASLLSCVLEHNRRDLLSLAVLTSRVLQLLEEGPDTSEDALESLALGHVYQKGGESRLALMAFRRAVALGVAGGEVDPAALRALAIAERRARNFEEAAGCWQRLLNSPECPSHVADEALQALAIHHEHRRRDFEAAKDFALRNLKSSTRRIAAVRHRLARLERKLERLSEPSLFPSWSSPPSCETLTSEPRTSS